MPIDIPLAKKTEWLKAHQEGKSHVDIAKSVSRDPRTVKKGIEEARRAQDSQAARIELVRAAIVKHQDALLGIIEGILSALVPPSPNLVLPLQHCDSPVTIPLSGATAKYESEGGWSVTLKDEDAALWELLQEHLRRDRMWNSVARWKRAVAAHLEAGIALKRQTAALLEEKTGLKLDLTQPTYVEPSGLELLYQVVLNRALGIPDSRNPEKNIRAPGDGYVLYFNSRIAKTEAGAEKKCRKGMLNALKELKVSAQVSEAAETYRRLEEVTARVRRAVEEVWLLGLVPGRCRVCRRLGM